MIEFSPLCLGRLKNEPMLDAILPLVDSLHCDIMDGQFVSPTAFTPKEINSLVCDVPKHVHIMAVDPRPYFIQLKGVNSISFHFEISESPMSLISSIRNLGFRVGMAINPKTSVKEIETILPDLDRLLIMAVEPGFSGQAFIEETENKIRQVRSLSKRIEISIDGGMNERTMKLVTGLGADSCVVCSVIAKAQDFEKQILTLRNACLIGASSIVMP